MDATNKCDEREVQICHHSLSGNPWEMDVYGVELRNSCCDNSPVNCTMGEDCSRARTGSCKEVPKCGEDLGMEHMYYFDTWEGKCKYNMPCGEYQYFD